MIDRETLKVGGFFAHECPVITFFMIITPPDILIADSAIRSYGKIKKVPFRLHVYSNWITPSLKARYFSGWRELPYVYLEENNWQDSSCRPRGLALEGPYERGAAIWDRELRKLDTQFFATVDADFEILDAEFIKVMLNMLDANPNLVAVATDRNPTRPSYYDSYTGRTICLQERLGSWFCIYRREALRCDVSHFRAEERDDDELPPRVWDDGGRFQKALREVYGYDLAVLDSKYMHCFIHYGAFSKNKDLDEANVALYRRLRILARRGILRKQNSLVNTLLRVSVYVVGLKFLYGYVDRSKYWHRR